MDARFVTLDVFTDRLFGGNPVAVFPDAGDVPETAYQAVARELNLSETVFVLPPARPGALRRLRIFTPTQELPFAGHPTVGTAILLAETGAAGPVAPSVQFVLDEGVGPVPATVTRREDQSLFAQLSVAALPETGPPPPERARLAEALGLRPEDLAGRPDEPEALTCGVPYLFIPVRDRSVLARARLDVARWESLLASYWAPHVYVFCRDPELPGSQLRARMFAPALGIPEDPATGSAAAALTGYLAARSPTRDGTLRWRLEQGFEMGRPCLLELECDLRAGQVEAVRIGGQAVRVSEGVMRVQ